MEFFLKKLDVCSQEICKTKNAVSDQLASLSFLHNRKKESIQSKVLQDSYSLYFFITELLAGTNLVQRKLAQTSPGSYGIGKLLGMYVVLVNAGKYILWRKAIYIYIYIYIYVNVNVYNLYVM